MPSWKETKKAVLVLTVVGLTLGMMHLTASEHRMSPFEAWTRDAVAPFQWGMWQTAQVGNSGAAFIFSLGRRNSYARTLEKKVADLEGEVRRLRAAEQENLRLKALLNYNVASNEPKVVAGVISRNPSNWFGTVVISRGTADGVKRNAVVVTPAGLVGRVLTVSNATAEVLLITDSRSAVGSAVYETQVPGIVRGTLIEAGGLKMQYVVKDEPVRKGFVVRTASLSGIFPAGIPVGTVTKVEEEESGLFKTVYLRPAVDLSRLEEVLVLPK